MHLCPLKVMYDLDWPNRSEVDVVGEDKRAPIYIGEIREAKLREDEVGLSARFV